MNVCILSSSTGGGHMSCALAIKNFFEEHGDNIKIFDTYEIISPFLNNTVNECYEFFASKTPGLYRFAYETSNNKEHASKAIVEINKLLSKKIFNLIKSLKPNIIIVTHPFAAEMVSKFKIEKKIFIPIICVITDYYPHRTWINEGIDAYVSGHECMNEKFFKLNVPENKIFPIGIPVKKTFYKEISDSEKLKTKLNLGLDKSKPVVLIMAGSWGFGNEILQIYKYLNYLKTEFQIIIITGKNVKLFKNFKNLCEKFSQNLVVQCLNENSNKQSLIREFFDKNSNKIKDRINKIKTYIRDINEENLNKLPNKIYEKNTMLLYFTKEISQYMAISDIIITKPGGLTITEAINRELPIIIINPVPGQEEENTKFLLKNGIGIKPNTPSEAAQIIEKLLNDKQKLSEIKVQCKNCKKNDTLKNIRDLSLNLCAKHIKTSEN